MPSGKIGLWKNANKKEKNVAVYEGKNKTIHVYFIKQKLFGHSPSSMLLNWDEVLLLTLHKNWLLWWFIRKIQYHTNAISLIDTHYQINLVSCMQDL